MNLHWFLSAKIRHATHMWKHVHKLVCAQRDILSAEAIRRVEESIGGLRQAVGANAGPQALDARMTELETVANKWLKPYPHAALRENVEVLLVAIAVAMGIRTFIAQPFKIPTGSMQPTLYGVTSNPDFQRLGPYLGHDSGLRPNPDFDVPNWVSRFFTFWFTGVGYNHIKADADGTLHESTRDQPTRVLLFNLKQDFYIGGVKHTAWFPPDRFLHRAGLIDPTGRVTPRPFQKGEDVVKMRSISGDHLFVDRVTYNFRRPRRGEIIVFETKNIPAMAEDQQGQFYIKRLVALGPEKVRIGDDRHLVIDGHRLDQSTPHFDQVYSFDPKEPPAESRYSGHVNNQVMPGLAPRFPDAKTEVEVPPDHYMVMGDNTVNSSDSRFWGSFPKENVIGRSFFVYWPMGRQSDRSSRFGWGVE